MKTLPTDEARQGRLGRPVLIVLIAGLVLAGAAALILHPFQQDAGTIDGDRPAQEDTQAG